MSEKDESPSFFEEQNSGNGTGLAKVEYSWQMGSPAKIISRTSLRYQDKEFEFHIQRQMKHTVARQAELFTRTMRQAELEFERGRQGAHLYKKLMAEMAYSMQELDEFCASCVETFSPDVALRTQAMAEAGKNIMQMLPALGTRVFLSRYS